MLEAASPAQNAWETGSTVKIHGEVEHSALETERAASTAVFMKRANSLAIPPAAGHGLRLSGVHRIATSPMTS